MKNRYNNFHDAVIRKTLFHYLNDEKLNISIDIECFDSIEDRWQLIRFIFKGVDEFVISSENIILEANFMESSHSTLVDFYFGYKTSFKKIREESKFYISYEKMEIVVLKTL